jgi:hypothetical protein
MLLLLVIHVQGSSVEKRLSPLLRHHKERNDPERHSVCDLDVLVKVPSFDLGFSNLIPARSHGMMPGDSKTRAFIKRNNIARMLELMTIGVSQIG